MQNIVLSIHLIIALCLIGAVLLQRSEGGGLGMGGNEAAMSGRGAANALTRLTWILAVGFLVTSITLTIIAAQQAGEDSVLDRLGIETITPETPASDLLPNLDAGDLALPPLDGTPAVPPSQ